MPDQGTIDAIEADLERYGVLIFPNQDISPAQQLSFSKAFAILELTGVAHVIRKVNTEQQLLIRKLIMASRIADVNLKMVN